MPNHAKKQRYRSAGAASSGRFASQGERISPDETRERLLNAAEALFARLGYDGTTLRLVADQAQANVAAANYHFGGKEALLQSMLARRLDPLAAARGAALDAYQREAAGSALTCELAMAALCVPALDLARDPARGGTDFLRLLGRAYVDPSPSLRGFLDERYAAIAARFRETFARALPHLPKAELSWRLHFVLGALSYTMARTDALSLLGTIRREDENDERLLGRLVPFLLAGLQAPTPSASIAALRVIPRAPVGAGARPTQATDAKTRSRTTRINPRRAA